MFIATSRARHHCPAQAVDDALALLQQKLPTAPHQIIAFFSQELDAEALRQALVFALPDTPIHACSSCGGFMTEEGLFEPQGDDGVLGLWAICDAEGSFGSAVSTLDDPVRSAREALTEAMMQTDRVGEAPAMIWLTATPGQEEQVIEGLQQLVGQHVPIQGGSAGDNQVSGDWSIFTQQASTCQGVAVSVLYPSGLTAPVFHNGYSPTEHRAVVTRAAGRTLYELDGEPAAEVYNRWTGGAVDNALEGGGHVLGQTTLFPLGREVDHIDQQPYFNLSHPETVTDDGALTLFSCIDEGETLVLLEGSISGLVQRAGRVATAAVAETDADLAQLMGGLAIYCAGCRLTVGDKMTDVVESIRQATAGAPFIGGFTFGEQGCFLNGDSRHGNLMISYVAFSERH